MGVNSLPKTVARQRRDCDLNPGPSAPESSTLTTWLPSHPGHTSSYQNQFTVAVSDRCCPLANVFDTFVFCQSLTNKANVDSTI